MKKLKGRQKITHGTGLKILTSMQMLQKALLHVKAGTKSLYQYKMETVFTNSKK